MSADIDNIDDMNNSDDIDNTDTSGSEATDITLRGEHITLDALLKASGLASSGGAAKQMILSGLVHVNGQAELRRGRKLRAGDRVAFAGAAVRITAPGAATEHRLDIRDPVD